MTYSVVIRRAAERDIERALDWYRDHAPDQVGRFASEFEAFVERIQGNPRSFRPLRGGARRGMLRVFPYKVWFRCLDEARLVEVLAVIHARQDATRLDDRLL